MPARDQPLAVLPRADGDRPPWAKVGLIAAAGFIVGIAWPRLAGMRIAPNPPSEGTPATPANHVAGPAGSAAAPAASAPPAASASAAPAAPVSINVGPGAILQCWDIGDDKRKECGSLQFDPIAVPKIKSLVQCPAAAKVSGKLSLGFDIDFRKKTVRLKVGKSTSIPRENADAIVRCAEPMFENLGLWEVPHDYRHYTLFYAAELSPPGKAEASADKPAVEGRVAGTTTGETPASGMATIGWDVALVRDAPKTGSVVGRILQGSKVKLVGRQGEWYHVQYGAIDGWVHRGAIGSGSTL